MGKCSLCSYFVLSLLAFVADISAYNVTAVPTAATKKMQPAKKKSKTDQHSGKESGDSAVNQKSSPKHSSHLPSFSSDQVDGYFNIKAVHERKNNRAFGPKNTSAVGFGPVVSVGPFTLDAAFYYGHQFSNASAAYNESHLIRTIPEECMSDFDNAFRKGANIEKVYKNSMSKNINKAHFYREYARLLYVNEDHDFRVVLGDTSTRNQIGSQRAVVGAGISIFRQKGNGSVITSSSPLVLTRPTKVECRLGDEILVITVLPSGTYYLDDLPEEAKIPGVKIKLSDQLNRGFDLLVDYFGGYGLLQKGESDFDISLINEWHYNIDDPYRQRYDKSPHFSGNYRFGITDEITAGAGLQFYKRAYLADFIAIFGTPAGKISPHLSFSMDGAAPADEKPEDATTTTKTKKVSRNGIAAGLYYCTPPNDLGIVLETFIGAKSKGFGDLRHTKEEDNRYNEFMEKYFIDTDALVSLRHRFRNTYSTSSSRQILSRIYTKPWFGVLTPAFTFNGVWSKSQRLREYTLSFNARIFKNVTLLISGGITYDDPHKGANQKSPDRRLTVALSIPIGDELKTSVSYYHHDEVRLQSYGMLEWKPSAIEGLELTTESFFRPGFFNPAFIAKYKGKHFNLRVDQSNSNSYPSSGSKSHSNRQRIFGGICISGDGLAPEEKHNFNVLSTAYERKAKAEKIKNQKKEKTKVGSAQEAAKLVKASLSEFGAKSSVKLPQKQNSN